MDQALGITFYTAPWVHTSDQSDQDHTLGPVTDYPEYIYSNMLWDKY